MKRTRKEKLLLMKMTGKEKLLLLKITGKEKYLDTPVKSKESEKELKDSMLMPFLNDEVAIYKECLEGIKRT